MASIPGRSELGEALRSCRNAFIGVGIMSCMINILYLTGSVFMLEVYDRVIPSRSVPTLVGLVILCGALYVAQGILDMLRGRILGRIGTSLDEALSGRVFDTIVRLPLLAGNRSDGMQPLRDLDSVRSFLGSMGPGAFFDLPWLPFYLVICFLFHWLIGVTALVGAIILVILTLITEFMSRQPAKDTLVLGARRNDIASSSRRNAEVLVAMGMAGRMNSRWSEANEKYLSGNQRASDVTGGLGAVAKVMRMMLQSAVLGVGAYLVIHQEATAGIIIAGSILSARALAPVDLAIAHWNRVVPERPMGAPCCVGAYTGGGAGRKVREQAGEAEERRRRRRRRWGFSAGTESQLLPKIAGCMGVRRHRPLPVSPAPTVWSAVATVTAGVDETRPVRRAMPLGVPNSPASEWLKTVTSVAGSPTCIEGAASHVELRLFWPELARTGSPVWTPE